MNTIEQNLILYYADYLALKLAKRCVTDNCKYYFIHGCPMNSAYIVDMSPIFDVEDPFYIQSYKELTNIKNKFGIEGVMSFLEDICMLRVRGTVNAIQMLKYICMYDTRIERKLAFADYFEWKNNKKYITTVEDEQGSKIEVECTKYVAHYNNRYNKRC